MYKCTCGDVFTVITPLISHEFGEWEIITEPTTEAEGERIRKCKHCEETEREVLEKLPAVVIGDVDGNGFVSSVDARWTLQIVAELRVPDERQLVAADANRDGYISSVDARWILQCAAELREL